MIYIHEGRMQFDKGLSEYVISNMNFDKQRKIRRDWVSMIASQMLSGDFLKDTNIIFGNVNKELILLDGQHRLSAVIESGITTQFIVTIVSLDSYDDVNKYYALTDQGRLREFNDTARAYDIRDKTGLSTTNINATAAAIRMLYSGFSSGNKRTKMSVIQVKNWVLQWSPYAILLLDKISGGDRDVSRKIRRAPVLAVALVTLRYQEQIAKDFWHQVSYDDGIRIGDPRKTLHKWLSESRTGGGGYSGKYFTNKESALYCVRAWDAFLNSNNLKMLRVSNAKQPVIIAGTPYDSSKNGYGIQ